MKASAAWKDWKQQWATLSLFQRFESAVALVLTAIIAMVVAVALYRLTASVMSGLVLGILDPLDPAVFQAIFGEILTLLIALEFNHSLQLVVTREQSIIQTKVVLLIGLLALTRKFIALDLKEVEPALLFGLAAMALALGIVYWLMRERDDRIAIDSRRSSG
ncbi:MAG: phosphate-starvation-inducible PsiE family protein [Usitatibacter sp.]